MIFGDYPCCGEVLSISMTNPDGIDLAGKTVPHTCEHCGAKVWTRFSRINPKTWTDKEFREEFDVDDVAKAVKRKAVPV